MQTQVEELAENRVRLEVEVPSEDVRHAVDHAASDLAESLRVPGFRKGKVPMPVLVARVGRDRIYAEAVESHIGGWFRNAAARTGIRPIAAPEYGYDVPTSADETFTFTATVAVQPKPELADWTGLEVPGPDAEVPAELVDQALDEIRSTVAELVPVEGRGAREGDTLVLDVTSSAGETQRDYVVDLGEGRLLPDLEEGLVGLTPGETKTIEFENREGETETAEATLKELKERVLPPLDDDLARAGSEFETLSGLREDIEARLRAQLEEEAEATFRANVADALVAASQVEVSDELVNARARALLAGLLQSLERRGVTIDTYLALTQDTPEQLQERLRGEARRSVARELVLDAAADQLEIEIADEDVESLVREELEGTDEDPAATAEALRRSGRFEQLREDLRLRRALDRIAADVTRISPELAQARDKLWTPEQEKTPRDTKLWTPGTKESE